jgi:hypothetical protein
MNDAQVFEKQNEELSEVPKVFAPRARAGSVRDFDIVLHIGHLKTATTWLQANIFGNPETGFVVPWADARARAIGAFVTANTYQWEPSWARGFFDEELERLADDPRVPVLSDETLCGNPLHRSYAGRYFADLIHQVFPRAKVVIGIREQKAMAISLYREYIHLGGTRPLVDFIGTGLEPLSFTSILREDFLAYAIVVGYYQKLYGRENVLVLPIERLQKDQAGFVRTILDFCGCPSRFTSEAKPNNVGRSAMALEALRALNPLCQTSPLSAGWKQPRHRVATRLCNAVNRLPRGWSAGIERRWKDLVARRYAGTFAESNRRLAELTGLDLASFGYDLG